MQHIGGPVEQFVGAMRRLPEGKANSPRSSEKSSELINRAWRGFDSEWPGDQREAVLALRRAREQVTAWVNGGIPGLVLCGHPGCGKTHLARVAVGWFNDPLYALMVAEPALKEDIQATYGREGMGSERAIIGRLRRAPRLILDDVGTAHVKPDSMPWFQEIYWRLLDQRAERDMPVMITTNLGIPDLAEWLGARAFSRLSGLVGNRDKNVVDMFAVRDYRMREWA